MSRITTKICDVCNESISATNDPSITIKNASRPDAIYDFHTKCFEEMEPRDVATAFLDLDDHLDLFEHRG